VIKRPTVVSPKVLPYITNISYDFFVGNKSQQHKVILLKQLILTFSTICFHPYTGTAWSSILVSL